MDLVTFSGFPRKSVISRDFCKTMPWCNGISPILESNFLEIVQFSEMSWISAIFGKRLENIENMQFYSKIDFGAKIRTFPEKVVEKP